MRKRSAAFLASTFLFIAASALGQPDISVSPDSLDKDLFTGETAVDTLTISNAGFSDLLFEISITENTATAPASRIFSLPEATFSNETIMEDRHKSEIPVQTAGTSGPLTATLADLSGKRIGIISEGVGYATIAADLQARGASVFNIFFPITSGELDTVHVLAIDDAIASATISDINAIRTWLQGGKGLLLQGDNSPSMSNLNLLLSGSGISETSYFSFFDGVFTNILIHPTTEGVNSVNAGAYGSYCTLVSPAQSLVIDNFSNTHAAASKLGSGRVIAVGNEFSANFNLLGGDTRLFANQVFDWLAAVVDFLSLNVTSGTIPAGFSQDIEVIFDATGLNGGDYLADILVTSNDPDESEVRIPAQLHVTGVPDIAVSPDSINFGSVFVSASKTDTVLVENFGTDLLIVTSVSSNNTDFTVDLANFSLDPDEDTSILVTFAPGSPSPISGLLTILCNDPDMPSVTVVLQGQGLIPPDIEVSPDSLDDSLFTGETAVQQLTISNTSGGSNLVWDINTAFADMVTSILESPVFSSPNFDLNNKETSESSSGRPDPSEIYTFDSLWNINSSNFSASTAATGLENILDNLNTGFATVTNTIPNRYDFSEGVSGYYIDDGGSDMYDGGNMLSTNLSGPFLGYSDNVIVNSADFGSGGRYFTRKYPGLFVMAADLQGVSYFQISGNVGADGGGNVDGAILTTELFGITYYGFVKRIYNAFGDPSVNHLIIVEEDPLIYHEFSTNTDDDYHRVVNLDGVTRIYYLLYAGTSGFYIDNAATLNIMNTFLTTLGLFPEWISASPNAGTITAGGTQIVDIIFDATGLNGGDYLADILISSNDPDESEVRVPAHLHVTGAPDIAISPDSVDFGSLFIGVSKTDTVVVENIGTDLLNVTNVSSNNSNFAIDLTGFSLDPGRDTVIPVTFTPTTAAVINGLLTIASNDPDMPSVTVTLQGEGLIPPDISVSPDSLDEDLFTGETSTQLLTVNNNGGSDLTVELSTQIVFGASRTSSPKLITKLERRLLASYESHPNKQIINSDNYAGQKFSSVQQTGQANPGGHATNEPVFAGLYTGDYLRFGLTDYGEIMPFQFPVGDEHLQLGTYLSGYTIAYRVSGIDQIAYAAHAGGRFRIVPVSYTEIVNNSSQVIVEVVTKTSDNLITFSQIFSFDRHDKYINIQTEIENVSGSTVTDIVFKSYADWDTDATFGGNWDYDLTRNMVYSWHFNYTAIATSRVPDLMDIDGWDDYRQRSTFVYFPTGPVFGVDGLEVLHFELGDLSSGSHTLIETVYGAGISLADLQQAIDRGIRFVNWLDFSPETAVIPAGTSSNFDIIFDATGLNDGDYLADILVTSNDPDEPEVRVPAHLHVTGAPDIAVSPDSVNFSSLLIGTSKIDTVLVKNIGTALLIVSNISSNNGDFVADTNSFTLDPGEGLEVIVTFTPSLAGPISGLLTISSNDPGSPTSSVVLQGQGLTPPVILVQPTAFEENLILTVNPIEVESLSISNNGGSDLVWNISIGSNNSNNQALYTLNVPEPDNNNINPEGSTGPQDAVLPDARTFPIQAYLNDLTGVKVLFDEYHSFSGSSVYWSTLISDLQTRGAIVAVNTSTITSTTLQDADIVWSLDMSGNYWSVAEIDALKNWLLAGGGLLIESDEFVSQYNALLTFLGAGILYSFGGSAGFATNVFPHEITAGVDSIYLAGPAAYLSTVTSPAGLLVKDRFGATNCAYSEVGNGRLVVMADENFVNGTIGLADNQLFGNQVIDWLSNALGWLTVNLDSGVVAPGADQSVIVTINGSDLQNGNYSAIISIQNNDPLTPILEVPVDVHVVEFICGDINSDAVVDQNDLIFSRQAYFFCGTAPQIVGPVDFNCNGHIDLSDILVLERYLSGMNTLNCCY